MVCLDTTAGLGSRDRTDRGSHIWRPRCATAGLFALAVLQFLPATDSSLQFVDIDPARHAHSKEKAWTRLAAEGTLLRLRISASENARRQHSPASVILPNSLALRGGGDHHLGGATEEEQVSDGEMEAEAETGTELADSEGQNATGVLLPLYQLTDSSDHDKTDEDGMPFNTNFTHTSSGGRNGTFARGCRHYSRGCQLVAACCNKTFWCRHCHNEEMDINCRDPKKAHQLDRFSVTRVLCSACDLAQSVQQNCERCGLCFGTYFCGICKFFDDDASKGHFHCDGCGICRIGGRENFFHCANCGCCYAMQLRDNHRCIAGAMHHNCPVCLEDLFHSTSQARVLRCGHTLHKKCLEQLLARDTPVHVCPLCKRTLVDHSLTWKQLDLAVACTPLPPELANRTVEMLCNDCYTKGTVPFHVYGLKCPNPECGGYNTGEIQVREIESFSTPEEAAGDSDAAAEEETSQSEAAELAEEEHDENQERFAGVGDAEKG